MRYLFRTKANLALERDIGKWWIDRDIISNITIGGCDNVNQALQVYRERVEQFGVTIAKSALSRKQPMYNLIGGNAVQIGYVINGWTDVDMGCNGFVTKPIVLWIEIFEINYPFK